MCVQLPEVVAAVASGAAWCVHWHCVRGCGKVQDPEKLQSKCIAAGITSCCRCAQAAVHIQGSPRCVQATWMHLQLRWPLSVP